MEKDILKTLCAGLSVDPLPENRGRTLQIAHAANKNLSLSPAEKKTAVANALRYFPSHTHKVLVKEFLEELDTYGHIYMYRFLPNVEIKAYPIDCYPCKTKKAAAIMLMIMNNLDRKIAQFPEELVTYGGNGQVFSNWAQFWIVLNYLSEISENQTLVMYSGHPLGLFPSSPSAPRCVITNGMVIPNYSSKEMYEKLFALNVTMYGQMTAGSYCYIGPQGIVHGTYLTILNIYRKYYGNDNLTGKVFLSSGLGGMSGAQAKAGYLLGAVTVIAEISEEALMKRYSQGWVKEVCYDLDKLIERVVECRLKGIATSIGFRGNIVNVLECFVDYYKKTGKLLVDLASDQTSCHNPFLGGYYPVQLSYEESKILMFENQHEFKRLVQESLKRQIEAIDQLTCHGTIFWDYGNALLLEASRAGADLSNHLDPTTTKFRYPSYMQDVMGDIFSLGFGPFRWVCTSNDENDLKKTDKIAESCILEILNSDDLPSNVRHQYEDNLKWIQGAGSWNLVVGSQARILYCDQLGRSKIALAFNENIKKGLLKGPIVISRDHHDVSGTDSPFRETSNIYDGSAFTADMAVQNVIGDSFRGATWVALHNGGGVGWGEVINGGFGLVIDGTEESEKNSQSMLGWDVSNGVTRRCWSGNANAKQTIIRTMNMSQDLKVTLPNHVDIDELFN